MILIVGEDLSFMQHSQIIVNPEQGHEIFMKKDRNFFKENPHESYYLRERFEDESLRDSPPYILVFNTGKGTRLRVPYYSSSVSDAILNGLKKSIEGSSRLWKNLYLNLSLSSGSTKTKVLAKNNSVNSYDINL
jgi:hypothetical protein